MLRTTQSRWILAGALIGVSAWLELGAAHAAPPVCAHCRDGGGGSIVDQAGLVCRDREFPQPDLFYNFYVPGICGGVPAEAYIAPRPVPPNVGHTYYTYQPLMPHEMLYKHHRVYHRYYDGGRGLTRTSVRWW